MSLISTFLNPKVIRSLGLTRTLRGLRTGDQTLLVTGLILVISGWLRSRQKGDRDLLVRKVVPLGSSLIIRHSADGTALPRIQIIESNSRA